MRNAIARAAAVLCFVEAARAESGGDHNNAEWFRSYRALILGGAR